MWPRECGRIFYTGTALNLCTLRSTFCMRQKLVLYSLLAVFWFSTSSSIASLRFSGDEAFAFVIFNSSLSTIFHCSCSESSIVTGVATSWSLGHANASGLQLDC